VTPQFGYHHATSCWRPARWFDQPFQEHIVAFLDTLSQTGVVAVIRGSSAANAIAISEALIRGGITGIEITYTTPDCCDAIAHMAKAYGSQAVIGVGTVTSVEQMHAAAEAGASFGVSPHFDAAIVKAAVDRGMPFMPGAITPTEVVTAYQAGATAIKIFPGSLVGPDYLKALKGPLPHIPLMPTGGVSAGNMDQWFAAGAVAVGMGGNLAKGSPDEVEAAAKATKAVLDRIRAS
jgi:2-dehydro-3-deoxyphosphogluconate aldolase/(4S)-4-hydroxy-2-oxoglutarate aldolase